MEVEQPQPAWVPLADENKILPTGNAVAVASHLWIGTGLYIEFTPTFPLILFLKWEHSAMTTRHQLTTNAIFFRY